MTLSRNLLAGLTSSIWTALVGLAVVPFYLKYLGIEAYGLVGFFSTMQSLFQILDLGLAPTMNREVARHSAAGNLSGSGQLLHTLSIIYWITAAAIGALVFIAAPFIARDWLHSKNLTPVVVEQAVMLMGLIAACRWPVALYLGTLMGAQRLIVSSGINTAMVAVANGGAIFILAFVSPTIQAFFLWQAAVGLSYALTMRFAAWKTIGKAAEIHFDFDALKRVWIFSAGMTGVALSALAFTQLDKLLLSRILGLGEFGEYTLATVVVNSLALLIMPFFNAVYPRFSALVANGNTLELTTLYHLGTRFLATILFPIAMLMAVFGEELIGLWTGNRGVAAQAAPLITVLAMGSAANGVMQFPYALQLAHGMTQLALMINGIILIVMIPATIFLAMTYGAFGGALAWLISQLMYVFLGTWLTHRRLLVGVASRWLLRDVGIPLALTVLTGTVCEYYVHDPSHSAHAKLICGGLLALMTMLISLILSPSLRAATLSKFERKGYNFGT